MTTLAALVALTALDKTTQIIIPWGDMMPWIFGIVLVVFSVPSFAFLVSKGFFKNFRLKIGKNEVDVGTPTVKADYSGPERREYTRLGDTKRSDIAYFHVFSALHDGKSSLKNSAWADQCAAIDDFEDEFFLLFDKRAMDQRDIDSAWNRFRNILISAADKNHVRKHVVDGEVDVEYLFDKVNQFKKKYEMLLTWTGTTLVGFDLVKEDIKRLCCTILSKFGRIADSSNDQFEELKMRLMSTIKDEDVRLVFEEVFR